MKRLRITAITLMLLLFAGSAAASAVETIKWRSLIPELDQSGNPYRKLPPDLQVDFVKLWTTYRLETSGNGNKLNDRRARRAIKSLREGGADPDQLIREQIAFVNLQKENESRLVESMNGKNVRITGYLLPIEFSGDRIVEFLLVPTNGACVHTPVPPANQLIHVRTERGIANPGLFAVVRVSGEMSTGRAERRVSYSDGEIPVVAGYSMAATGVELYE